MNQFNYWERLEKLGIMSLQRRREKIIVVHLWKILNNINPNSFHIEFKEHLRTSSIRAIVKPLPKLRGAVLTSYDESFVVKSARLWNKIPPELTKITSLALFSTKLEGFLSGLTDKSPLPGYHCSSDNSVLSICA